MWHWLDNAIAIARQVTHGNQKLPGRIDFENLAKIKKALEENASQPRARRKHLASNSKKSACACVKQGSRQAPDTVKGYRKRARVVHA